MPIYEYQCQDCGHKLEAMQKMADDPLCVCPVCTKPALKKLVSAAAFRLSGSGWYETDFKTGNKKNVAGDGGDKSPEPAAKSPASDKTGDSAASSASGSSSTSSSSGSSDSKSTANTGAAAP